MEKVEEFGCDFAALKRKISVKQQFSLLLLTDWSAVFYVAHFLKEFFNAPYLSKLPEMFFPNFLFGVYKNVFPCLVSVHDMLFLSRQTFSLDSNGMLAHHCNESKVLSNSPSIIWVQSLQCGTCMLAFQDKMQFFCQKRESEVWRFNLPIKNLINFWSTSAL